jgi:uncharacterized membrane protein YdjX (TVP38/TMEM64 family)
MNKTVIKFLFAFGILILLLFAAYSNQSLFIKALAALQTLAEPQLLICFCLLYIFCNLLLLPIGLPLNLFAGLTWGTLAGGTIVNLLATFVAAISFLLARNFRHHFLDNFLARKSFFRSLKETINRYDWQFISMARINPVVPFSLSNYLFGLIPELSFRHYIIATIIANLLPCFIFAALGSMIKSFSIANNSQIHYFILEASIVVLLVSVLVTVKMLLSNHQRKFLINKETHENHLMCHDTK